MADCILETGYPSAYKSEDEFCSIICLDILSGKRETLRKYRNQSLARGNLVKKPSTFRLDINLETDNSSKTNYPSVSTSSRSDVLTDESASDEFCFTIRLSTEFILGTNYPSETDNRSRRIIRL